MTAPISEKSALVQVPQQKKAAAGESGSESNPLGYFKHDMVDLNGPEDEGVSIPEFGWATDLSWSDSVSGSIDSKSISTAYSTPAESREATSNELNVSKAGGGEALISREIGLQEQAQGESQRRADQAQGALEAMESNQRQLESGRGEADEQKTARLHRSAEGEKEVQVGEKRLETQSQQLEELQTAGERLLTKQARTESAVEETQTEIHRTADVVVKVKQDAKDADRDMQEHFENDAPGQAKKEVGGVAGPPAPQGNLGNSGNAGKAAGAIGAPAGKATPATPAAPGKADPGKSQSDTGKPGAGKTASHKPKPVTRQGKIKRAKQARTAQVIAERKQKSLQDKQTHLKKVSQQHDWGAADVKHKLHNLQESRRRGADGLQTARKNLQQDVDGLRDLGVKTQHIHSQLEELKAGQLQAMKARTSNLQNAQSAGRNAEQLKGVRSQLAQQPQAQTPSAGLSPWTTQAAGRPGAANDNSLTRPVDQLGTPVARNGNSTAMPAPAENSLTARDQGNSVHIRLIRLNEGQGSAGADQNLSLGRSQGRIADEQNQRQAELQAKATATQAQAAAPGQETAMVHNAPSLGNNLLGGIRSDQGTRSFL